MSGPRIGLVHALRDSMPPLDAALAEHWPEAVALHLFDGSLYADRNRATATEAEIERRIARLLRHSAEAGAAGILFSGSFFGAAVEMGREGLSVPVLTSFDGIVEAAFAADTDFQVLSSAPDSATLLVAELERRAEGRAVRARPHSVPEAIAALLAGEPERHDEAVAAAAAALPPEGTILLAQFSMGRAKSLAEARSGRRILAAAEAGVLHLKRLLAG
ncbi:MAG: aspartate/glutamate racemase family protein [Alphaproteobacteria bacterium]